MVAIRPNFGISILERFSSAMLLLEARALHIEAYWPERRLSRDDVHFVTILLI